MARPFGGTVRVHGYREFRRAARLAGPEARRELRDALKDVGENVRERSEQLFSRIDPRSAAGYRVRVRARGIAVEQSIARTTGARPDYGAIQMRFALLPAATREEARTEQNLEAALDRLGDHFEHR